MAVAEQTGTEAVATPAPRRKRSFRPRYPAWLTAPSLVYYAIFFLGPMAILVAFSLATQRGFGSHAGVTAFFTDALTFTHNHVHTVAYNGINLGWGWRNFPDSTTCKNNT